MLFISIQYYLTHLLSQQQSLVFSSKSSNYYIHTRIIIGITLLLFNAFLSKKTSKVNTTIFIWFMIKGIDNHDQIFPDS